jgi:hypothetical protein
MHFIGLWTANSEGYVIKAYNEVMPFWIKVRPSSASNFVYIVIFGFGRWLIIGTSSFES